MYLKDKNKIMSIVIIIIDRLINWGKFLFIGLLKGWEKIIFKK